MKRLYQYLIVIILSVLTVYLYKSATKNIYTDAVEQWIGKEILFPDSMMTVSGEIIAPPKTDFTIVSYYDSTGCTGCRMKLPLWNRFMEKVDSIRGDKSITLILVAATSKLNELKHILKLNSFSGNLVNDPQNRIDKLNRFSDAIELQTFLIDNNHRVIALGNPVVNGKLGNIYISKIGNTNYNNQLSNQNEDVYEFNFGKVKSGEMISHTFILHNENTDTLKVHDLITSCECTSGTLSSNKIPPGEKYELKVEFKDTVFGEFFRTIMIHFDNKKSVVRVELSGEITNKIQ